MYYEIENTKIIIGTESGPFVKDDIPVLPDLSLKAMDDTGAALPSYVTLVFPDTRFWLTETMFAAADETLLVYTS